jgi:hypothetical protein
MAGNFPSNLSRKISNGAHVKMAILSGGEDLFLPNEIRVASAERFM